MSVTKFLLYCWVIAMSILLAIALMFPEWFRLSDAEMFGRILR